MRGERAKRNENAVSEGDSRRVLGCEYSEGEKASERGSEREREKHFLYRYAERMTRKHHAIHASLGCYVQNTNQLACARERIVSGSIRISAGARLSPPDRISSTHRRTFQFDFLGKVKYRSACTHIRRATPSVIPGEYSCFFLSSVRLCVQCIVFDLKQHVSFCC